MSTKRLALNAVIFFSVMSISMHMFHGIYQRTRSIPVKEEDFKYDTSSLISALAFSPISTHTAGMSVLLPVHVPEIVRQQNISSNDPFHQIGMHLSNTQPTSSHLLHPSTMFTTAISEHSPVKEAVNTARLGTLANQVYVNGFWVDRDTELNKEESSNAEQKQEMRMMAPPEINEAKPIISLEKNARFSAHTVSHGVVSLIPFVAKYVKDADSLVYLSKFWFEKRLSYAVDTDGDGYMNTISDPYYKARILTSKAPSLSWFREDRSHMYFMSPTKKGDHPNTFSKLATSMKNVLRNVTGQGLVINALRYHMHLTHCDLLNKAGSMNDLPVPLITTSRLDENTGSFSSDIWPKTCSVTSTYDHKNNMCREAYHLNTTLSKCKKTYEDYQNVLEHPKFLLALTSQHHAFPHRKIYSLPLGVRPGSAQLIAQFLREQITKGFYVSPEKKKLLLINNSGWWYRAKVNAYFKEKFNEANSYSFLKGNNSTKTPKQKNMEYLNEISNTKYVICPPGIGYDTYRMWEVIASGAVAVVESSPGLDKTYSLLPVLVVDDLRRLTKQFLEDVYSCFLDNADKWRFDILTQEYWDNSIAQALLSGSIEHLHLMHPSRNPYCWFLEESKNLVGV